MDGTTLNESGVLTPATISAIHKANQVMKVIIATGRPSMSLQPFIDIINLPEPVDVVCFNGASCMRLKAGEPEAAETLFHGGLEKEHSEAVLKVCEELDLCIIYCRPECSAAKVEHEKHESILKRFECLEKVQQDRSTDVKELIEAGELPLKILALSEDPEMDAKKAMSLMPDGMELTVIPAEMHIEFLNPLLSKGHSLERLVVEYLKLNMSQVIAYGDNHNDVEMIKRVGEGVAMMNAKPVVKEAARRVCEWTNEEEGVAKELEQLVARANLVN